MGHEYRYHNYRILRALRFMYRYCICKDKLIKLLLLIHNRSAVKVYYKLPFIGINRSDNAYIAVEYFLIIVVSYLHYLVILLILRTRTAQIDLTWV